MAIPSRFMRNATKNVLRDVDAAKVIKAGTTSLKSNMTKSQVRVLSQAGETATRVAGEIGDAMRLQVNGKTATKAINNVPHGARTAQKVVNVKTTESATQEAAKNIVNNRRKTIENYKNKTNLNQTDLDTIVNNIKDRQGTRDLNTTKKKTIPKDIAENMINHRKNTTKIGNVAMPSEAQYYGYAFGTDIDKAYGRQNLLNGNGDISGVMDDIKTSEITGNYNRSQTRQQSKPKPQPNPEPQSNKDKIKNGIMDNVFGGLTETYQNGIKGDKGLWNSFVDAHTKDDGSIRMGRAVGTFMAASAAARVATGGGLYKDRYGNPNIIGVPFI